MGIIAGVIAARVLGRSQAHDWCEPELLSIAVVMVPLLAYSTGVALHGNGFIAAFVAGTAFAAATS